MSGILQVKGGRGGFQKPFSNFCGAFMRNRAVQKGHTAFKSPLCLGSQPAPIFGTSAVAITGILTGFILAFAIFIAWVFSIDA